MTFSAQSGDSIPRVVWNWPGKTLFPGAPLFLLDFSSAIFSRSFDFRAFLLTAPGSPRMTLESQSVEEGNLSQSFFTQISKRFRSYFKRSSTNHAALGIIGSGGSRPSAKEGDRLLRLDYEC